MVPLSNMHWRWCRGTRILRGNGHDACCLGEDCPACQHILKEIQLSEDCVSRPLMTPPLGVRWDPLLLTELPSLDDKRDRSERRSN
jgi:hypothetical protein